MMELLDVTSRSDKFPDFESRFPIPPRPGDKIEVRGHKGESLRLEVVEIAFEEIEGPIPKAGLVGVFGAIVIAE